MNVTHLDERHRTQEPAARPSAPRHPATSSESGAAEVVRLTCFLCEETFVLDLEEGWGTVPEDIEREGREFLDIRADAVLCSRCLHSVKVAGAERIYWRLAHC